VEQAYRVARERALMPIEDQLIFLLKAVPVTLSISALAFLLGFPLGVLLAVLRLYGGRALRALAEAYEKVFRSVPVLAVMLFFYFGVGGYVHAFKDPYFTSVMSLGLISAANQSQIFRSAIGSVGRSQMLAALSLGLTTWKAVRHVILPQALIAALPALGSEIALLIKDSSYSFIIGVMELMKHADILRAATRSPVLPYLAAALIYVALTFPLANYLDRRGTRMKRKLGL